MLFFCGFSEYGLQFIANTTTASADEKIVEQKVVFEPRQIRCVVDAGAGDGCIDAARTAASWSTLIIAADKAVHVHGFCDGLPCQQRALTSHAGVRNVAASWSNAYLITRDGRCSVVQNYDFSSSTNVVTETEQSDVKFTAVSSGERHTVAVRDDNIVGEIIKTKPGVFIYKPLPLKILVKSVSCGKEHVLILSKIGVVLTLGGGSRGQLGHGNTDSQSEAKVIEALEGVSMTAVSAGGWHSLALSDIGDVYAWGWNESGQVGLPCRSVSGQNVSEAKTTGRSKPCSNNGIDTREVHNRDAHNSDNQRISMEGKELDLDATNRGGDENVQIQTEPCLIEISPDRTGCSDDSLDVTAISCGSRHSAAVTGNGLLFTWGWNGYGQLGSGNRQDQDKPQLVDFFKKRALQVTDVACGYWISVIMVRPI